MPKAVFISPDGSSIELKIPVGTSLMSAAVSNGIEHIVGDCGGSASCATCHVYVEPSYLSHLPEMQSDEDEMLEDTAEKRTENSRLSCQLIMKDELDGITVRMPDTQW